MSSRAVAYRLFPIILLASASAAHAHPGGLNGAGCHNNRRTGDYHCHGGGGYSGGGYSSPAPAPVCEDVTRDRIDVTLVMSDNREKSAANVSIKKVSARLDGAQGSLYSYTVQGLAVRNFVDESGNNSKFSFAQSSWIPAQSVEKDGNTTISRLQPNGIGVVQENYISNEYQERICR
jgi:hypothetical protein